MPCYLVIIEMVLHPSSDNKFDPNKQLLLLQLDYDNYDMLIANIVSSNSFEKIYRISIDARTDAEVAKTW